MVIRTIEQSVLTLDRMMFAQAKKIEGLMQSVLLAQFFCERTGLSASLAETLPAWFFLDEGERERRRALKLAKIYDEARDLKFCYSDQLVSRIKDEYVSLYAYVISDYKEGSFFISVINTHLESS